MQDKMQEILATLEGLSDNQLDTVVGGRITDGDRRRLDEFVRMCKYYGASLDEAIAEIHKSFKKPQAQHYVEEYIEYVREIW